MDCAGCGKELSPGTGSNDWQAVDPVDPKTLLHFHGSACMKLWMETIAKAANKEPDASPDR